MARFVTFPGTSGAYVSTDDVNLLDADTAHLVQSEGEWDAGGAVTIDAAAFGGFALQRTISTGTFWQARGGPMASTLPVLPNTAYSVRGRLKADAANVTDLAFYIQWLDSGGTQISLSNSSLIPVSGFAFKDYDAYLSVPGANDIVSPAGAAFATIITRWIATASTDVSIGSVCFRLGTDPTFKPSLRIVGDLSIEVDAAATLWTPSAAQDLLSRWAPAPDQAYRVRVPTAGGQTDFLFSLDGTTQLSLSSSGGLVDGQEYLLRFERVAATGAVEIFVDGVSDATATLAAGPLNGGASDLFVGSRDATLNPFAGDIWTATVRDGIGGPIVAEFDATDIGI